MHDEGPPALRIYPLTRSAEGRDPETIGHVERVCAYSAILARQLSGHRRFRGTVTDAFVRRLAVAAALHDAGKASIPQSVLLKPAPLTEAESDVVRRHTTLGAEAIDRLLADHPDVAFRDLAVEVALTHHERWDGTGYPRGLAGETIPVGGRIVALADVYDALTSKRAYKAAYTHDLARGVVLHGRGTHFDPAVVDAFVAAEHAVLAAAAEHAERQLRAA